MITLICSTFNSFGKNSQIIPLKKVYGVPEGVADHAIPKKFRVKLAKTSQSEEQNGVGIGIGKHPPSNVGVG